MRQLIICLRPHALLGFVLGWTNNFVGSESGHIQSVKVLQLWSPTRINTHTIG
jgi:hypothetical protein